LDGVLGARLQTTPEEILDAVLRGWLPEQIEVVSSKYALEGIVTLIGFAAKSR
jgi:hypothetical protein